MTASTITIVPVPASRRAAIIGGDQEILCMPGQTHYHPGQLVALSAGRAAIKATIVSQFYRRACDITDDDAKRAGYADAAALLIDMGKIHGGGTEAVSTVSFVRFVHGHIIKTREADA